MHQQRLNLGILFSEFKMQNKMFHAHQQPQQRPKDANWFLLGEIQISLELMCFLLLP